MGLVTYMEINKITHYIIHHKNNNIQYTNYSCFCCLPIPISILHAYPNTCP